MAGSIKSRFRDWLNSDIEIKSSLAEPEKWLSNLLDGTTGGTGPVTASTALRHPAAACAIRVIAEAVATLPVITYRRLADNSKERATDHPVYGLLHDDANGWQSAFDLKLAVTIDALSHDKGGFAYVNRVGGRPVELLRLDPAKVAVDYSPMGEPSYTFENRVFAREDILHVRAPGGVAPLTTAREAIALANLMENHGAGLFRNGARPSGVISLEGDINATTLAAVREAWTSAVGVVKPGGVAVLDKSAKYTPLAFSSVDSQFLELRTYQILEIARAFRVPPHMLYELDRATWSNTGEMGQAFLTYSLLPWLEAWTSAIRRACFTAEERADYIPEFLVDDLLRADPLSRATTTSTLIACRALSPNEARAMDDRPPYDGGDEFVNPHTTSASQPPAPSPVEEAA